MEAIKYKLRDVDKLIPSRPFEELPVQAGVFILHRDISISFHFANSVYWDLYQRLINDNIRSQSEN